MSWGLGWKRPSDVFHLTLSYGEDEALDESTPTSSRSSSSTSVHTSPFSPSPPSPPAEGQEENNQEELLGFRVDLDWNVGDDEDQVALKLQSQVMVALPSPQDTVEVEFKDKKENENAAEEDMGEVAVEMRVVKRREPLKGVMMWRVGSSSQQSDGMGVLSKLIRSNFANGGALGIGEGSPVGCADHWKSVTVVSLCGLGLMVSDSCFNISSYLQVFMNLQLILISNFEFKIISSSCQTIIIGLR